MLKPIVSMNKMAMNESIATTCCYIWNGTSVAGSAILPYGGNLYQNKVSTYYYPKTDLAVSSAWLDLPLVAKNEAAARALDLSSHVNLPIKSNGNWYVGSEPLTRENGMELTALGDQYYKVGNPRAEYAVYVTSGDMMHANAKAAHANVNNQNRWLADHKAYQYAS